MGAYLAKPKTEKVTKKGEGNGLRFGLAAMQGWRVEMEDAHTDIVGLSEELKDWSFFGVFDGHAGSAASVYCAENLLSCVLSCEEFTAALKNGPSCPDLEQLKVGLTQGFLELDRKMKSQPRWRSGDDKSGTTAVTVMVTPDHVIFANCGDSRGLLSTNGEVTLHTTDHKPANPDEKMRIEAAGGSVVLQRVNGSLAVSRALGDFEYKMETDLSAVAQLVSPEPDVLVQPRQSQADEFVVLACDGVWDVMSNEEVADFIRARMLLSEDLALVCSELIDTCIAKGSRDNISAALIAFPAAPKVTTEAIEQEAQVNADLEKRVTTLISDSADVSEIDMPFVMQSLAGESIQGLPPGGGLPAKHSFVEGLLEKLLAPKENQDGDPKDGEDA